MTVLLISFKQYDRVSRPNLGDGGPLAGEGAGGVEKGGSVEGESLGCRVMRQGGGVGRGQEYQHPSMRYAGRGAGWEEEEGGRTKEKQQGEKKGKEKDTVNTSKHTTEPGRQHRSKPST